MTVLFFFGPPGSGKGTQIELLAQKLGLFHFVASAVGVEYIDKHKEDAESREQKRRLEAGLLFDAQWMYKVVIEKTKEILSSGESRGIIFDGSPRTLFEAQHLYDFLKNLIGEENIKIVDIEIAPEKLVSRIEKRLICDQSPKHVFIKSDDLNAGDRCPEGDGLLKKRDMDKLEIFEIRMKAYQEGTLPGLDYLKSVHKVIIINGDQPIEKVQEDILKKLNDKN